jgi:2-polyprenyl-6-methoxyphenol hydroxylase-like FAD-dependent oxidoreductase
MLLISQADTEAILSKLLYERGGKIHRLVKVLGMEELAPGREDGYKFNVTFEGGESILTKSIVGCDGGRSVVSVLFDNTTCLLTSFLLY